MVNHKSLVKLSDCDLRMRTLEKTLGLRIYEQQKNFLTLRECQVKLDTKVKMLLVLVTGLWIPVTILVISKFL